MQPYNLTYIVDILASVCIEGWLDINGKCYMFSKDLNGAEAASKKLTFDEAAATCSQRGGRLFEPRNEHIFNAIAKVNQCYF